MAGGKKTRSRITRATRLALFALGFAMCGVAIPSLIKILDYTLLSETIFVILYLGFGLWMMISEGLRLRKLKQDLEKLESWRG